MNNCLKKKKKKVDKVYLGRNVSEGKGEPDRSVLDSALDQDTHAVSTLPTFQKQNIKLLQGSASYRTSKMAEFTQTRLVR